MRAIGDKTDVSIVALTPSQSDLKSLDTILNSRFVDREPNMVFHVFKNRRGKHSKVRVWSYVDLGTCRITDLFMTDNDYNLIPIEETTIETYDIDEDDTVDVNTGELLQNF